MTPYLILTILRALNTVVLITLFISAYRYHRTSFGARFCFLVATIIWEASVLLFNILVIIPPGTVTNTALNVASIAVVPPIIGKCYLIGVFRGWWNGIS